VTIRWLVTVIFDIARDVTDSFAAAAAINYTLQYFSVFGLTKIAANIAYTPVRN